MTKSKKIIENDYNVIECPDLLRTKCYKGYYYTNNKNFCTNAYKESKLCKDYPECTYKKYLQKCIDFDKLKEYIYNYLDSYIINKYSLTNNKDYTITEYLIDILKNVKNDVNKKENKLEEIEKLISWQYSENLNPKLLTGLLDKIKEILKDE